VEKRSTEGAEDGQARRCLTVNGGEVFNYKGTDLGKERNWDPLPGSKGADSRGGKSEMIPRKKNGTSIKQRSELTLCGVESRGDRPCEYDAEKSGGSQRGKRGNIFKRFF